MNSIVWADLKQTPPDSYGLIPGMGIRYYHLKGDAFRAEQILVHDGDDFIRIIRTPSLKSGWSKPDRIKAYPINRNGKQWIVITG